jgi:hypothetical protein
MKRITEWLKQPRVWGFFLSMAILAIISIAFFYPDNFQGNSLRQADAMQGAANGHEAMEYYNATGEKALWTDALFGGMPTFQISPSYPSNGLFDWLNQVYGLGLPSPSNLLFMMMFGFLILLYVLGLEWYYALIGSVAWGLSSYFVIIIGAGHIWKFVTLSYIPPTIAGLILCYRGRYLAGAAMMSLFAMLQLNANHPQMSYYFGLLILALVIAWLVEAIREKQVKRWAIASCVSLAAGVLALGANMPNLYNTYEYSKETKRSQSELTPIESASSSTPDEKPTGGLPRHEIVGWSYGWSESFSLLMPNIKGGASAKPEGGHIVAMSLDRLEDAKQYEGTESGALLPYMTQYFNDSEGTNGPVYVGAIIFALFLAGCFLLKGPIKWALLVSTVLAWLLALGANFESLTDFMIYHFPLYNKFRAVESIMVVVEFTMPLMAILTLKEILTNPEYRDKKSQVSVFFAVCGAFCLLAMIVPSAFGGAITSTDKAYASNIMQQVTQMAQQYGYSGNDIQQIAYQYSLQNPANVQAIESLRYGMVRSDAMRSLILLALAWGLIMLSLRGQLKKSLALAGLGLLVTFDLYNVDKRYVDHSSFVAVSGATPDFTPDAIDQAILKDTDHYRVMDIPGFWLHNRSYFHKTIGGYHAAKLNRYEDLIQRQLQPVIQSGYYPELRVDSIRATYPAEAQPQIAALLSSYRVLDMLNARYIITGDEDAPVMQNSFALGNAWLVGKISYVDNADEEMAALGKLDPASEAVADRRFADILGSAGDVAEGDTIYLTQYTPNSVSYESDSKNATIGVFSEVWFPWGWQATIDGQPAQIGRVNYLLRAMAIPAGHHKIVMRFDPESLHVTGGVAYASISLIYLLLIAAVFVEYRRRK